MQFHELDSSDRQRLRDSAALLSKIVTALFVAIRAGQQPGAILGDVVERDPAFALRGIPAARVIKPRQPAVGGDRWPGARRAGHRLDESPRRSAA